MIPRSGMLRGIFVKFRIEITIVIDMQGLLLLVWHLRIFPERGEDQRVSDPGRVLIVRFLFLCSAKLPQHHILLITLQTPPFRID